MEDTQAIIKELMQLDYKANPYEKTRALLSSLGKFGLIALRLEANNEFIRARPLGNGEKINTVSDLSYKPQKYNTTYQRASTPNNTMFYAGLVQPEFTPDGFLAMGRLIGLMESLPFMRDKASKAIKKVAFGKWSNTRHLNLAAVVYDSQFAKANPQTEFLHEAFNTHVLEIQDLTEKTLTVTNFLASEFSKDNIADQYDYMISAIFTEIATEKGFDGVLYPSVRTLGKGLNVAIRPDIADKYLELRAAGECTVYKNQANTSILNNSVSIIPRGQNELKLKPFDTAEKLEFAHKYTVHKLGLQDLV